MRETKTAGKQTYLLASIEHGAPAMSPVIDRIQGGLAGAPFFFTDIAKYEKSDMIIAAHGVVVVANAGREHVSKPRSKKLQPTLAGNPSNRASKAIFLICGTPPPTPFFFKGFGRKLGTNPSFFLTTKYHHLALLTGDC